MLILGWGIPAERLVSLLWHTRHFPRCWMILEPWGILLAPRFARIRALVVFLRFRMMMAILILMYGHCPRLQLGLLPLLGEEEGGVAVVHARR